MEKRLELNEFLHGQWMVECLQGYFLLEIELQFTSTLYRTKALTLRLYEIDCVCS